MSKRESILDAVAAKVTALGGITAYRSRQQSAVIAEGVIAIVEPQSEAIEPYQLDGTKLRTLTLTVAILTRGAIPDQVADPYVEGLESSIRADETLGGLVLRCFGTELAWQFSDADGLGAAETTLTLTAAYLV